MGKGEADILFFLYLFAVAAGVIFVVAREIRRSKSERPKKKKWTKEELEARSRELQKEIDKKFDEFYQKFFTDKEFINKNTTRLEDFIINEKLNGYDLHKLAQLNRIKVEMSGGWTELTLDLLRELDKTGWNRKVGSIKEKFGELRFYADTNHGDIIDKYTEMSKTICEVCGASGELVTIGGWDQTLCKAHQKK